MLIQTELFKSEQVTLHCFTIFPFFTSHGDDYHCEMSCCLGSGRGGASPGPTNKLFISNLSYDTEVDSLQELFSNANDVYLPKNRETGEKRG